MGAAKPLKNPNVPTTLEGSFLMYETNISVYADPTFMENLVDLYS